MSALARSPRLLRVGARAWADPARTCAAASSACTADQYCQPRQPATERISRGDGGVDELGVVLPPVPGARQFVPALRNRRIQPWFSFRNGFGGAVRRRCEARDRLFGGEERCSPPPRRGFSGDLAGGDLVVAEDDSEAGPARVGLLHLRLEAAAGAEHARRAPRRAGARARRQASRAAASPACTTKASGSWRGARARRPAS